jgi:hypothetical protein
MIFCVEKYVSLLYEIEILMQIYYSMGLMRYLILKRVNRCILKKK